MQKILRMKKKLLYEQFDEEDTCVMIKKTKDTLMGKNDKAACIDADGATW